MSFLSPQRGAVLVVSLVLLLAMTLISTSSLRNATNQSRMVNNAQQFNLTFHTAENSLAKALNSLNLPSVDTNNNMQTLTNSVQENAVMTVVDNAYDDKGITVTLVYQTTPSTLLRAGISLDASNDNSMIQSVNFNVTSTAEITNSGAKTTLSRGFIYE